MIAFIKGTVEHIIENFVLLDCNGVGYRIYLTGSSLQTVSQTPEGEVIKLFTYMYVKEDGTSLYGFLTLEEYDLFNMLITVNGVGPKAAMSVLSVAPPSQLLLYIATEDADMITKAQGIGSKTAQRIVLDLKDKVKKMALPASMQAQTSLGNISGGQSQDALDALISLGYSRNESLKAISQVDLNLPIEKVIKTALKKIIENR